MEQNGLKIVDLDRDNSEDYSGYFGVDVTEYLGRSVYHGLVAVNEEGEVRGGMIWEYSALRSFEEHKSMIRWYRAEDEETSVLLFSAYGERVADDGISISEFVLPATDNREIKGVFESQGFSVRLMESDMIRLKVSELLEKPVTKGALSPKVRPIRELSKAGFHQVVRSMAMVGDHELSEDFLHLPKEYFDQDVSQACVADDQIMGLMLLHRRESGALELLLLSATGKDYRNVLVSLIRSVAAAVGQKYDGNTEFFINRGSYAALMASEKLLPYNMGVAVYEGCRQEKGEI